MTLATALIADARGLDHDPGAWHPESPVRLRALLDLLDGPVGGGCLRLEPRAATVEDLELVHTPAHVARVAASENVERTDFDPDTSGGPATYGAARLSAGAAPTLVDAVMAGDARNGLSLMRPPGHHAEADRTCGFCFFDGIAIAARHLRERHGVRRILILDWDVHHGNGTQHAFEEDPDVLFVSIHQFPFFPGTGARSERGRGRGEGATVNVPLPAGSGDADYRRVWEGVVEPAARAFAPEFVLVSAGYDGDARDPLAGMRLTTEAFRRMSRSGVEIARDHADGRLVAVLEGGYHLDALRQGVTATIEELRREI